MFNKVLLVDDNKVNNVINARLLEIISFAKSITVKTNGEEALDHLMRKSLEGDEHIPEIIFLDVRMPIMDGFDFLEAFATLPEAVLRKSRVLMLTSSLDDDDYVRARRSPYMLKFVDKPLNKEKLMHSELKELEKLYVQSLKRMVIV